MKNDCFQWWWENDASPLSLMLSSAGHTEADEAFSGAEACPGAGIPRPKLWRLQPSWYLATLRRFAFLWDDLMVFTCKCFLVDWSITSLCKHSIRLLCKVIPPALNHVFVSGIKMARVLPNNFFFKCNPKLPSQKGDLELSNTLQTRSSSLWGNKSFRWWLGQSVSLLFWAPVTLSNANAFALTFSSVSHQNLHGPCQWCNPPVSSNSLPLENYRLSIVKWHWKPLIFGDDVVSEVQSSPRRGKPQAHDGRYGWFLSHFDLRGWWKWLIGLQRRLVFFGRWKWIQVLAVV